MPMPISIAPAPIEGLLIIKTGVFHDDRGSFSESYSRDMWAAAGFHETFVQDNISRSRKGVLRGLHYQILPHGMGKLVRCLSGAVYDVAVDLRRASPTFGRHFGIELNAENQLSLWVPVGFAHGFVALADDTLVHYKCTAHHAPEAERSLRWDCPRLAVPWPLRPHIISAKDAAAPDLDHADFNF